MFIQRSLAFVSLCALAGMGGACATVDAPPELVAARTAYVRVSSGPARQVTPVEVDNARLALDDAEMAFRDHGDVLTTRDLAYVAERRSLQAGAVARVAIAQQQSAELQADRVQRQAALYAQTSAALEQEHRARIEAEATASAALDSLRRVARVHDEARGTVITLSGEVLFVSGESVLLPIAQERLEQVAAMLREHRHQDIVVEGHTDSQGSATENTDLSLARAEVVREFLVANGVPLDRIHAQGLGPSRPVADNSTPEGRADNRRVEIVIAPERPPEAIGGGPVLP